MIIDQVKRRSASAYHQAMRLCPRAREFELRWPIELAAPRHGEIIVDFPSGGSYLRPHIDAVSPGAILRPVEHVADYLKDDDSILQGSWNRLPFAEGEADIVVTLAALHHVIVGRPIFYQECHRILAPGGRLIIGDVEAGTPPAAFLDQFVKRYSSQGHEARFLSRDTELANLEGAGFRVVEYEVTAFHWVYPDKLTAIRFCRHLFRLDQASDDQIWHGLGEYLGIESGRHGVRMNWQLAFVRADWQEPGRSLPDKVTPRYLPDS